MMRPLSRLSSGAAKLIRKCESFAEKTLPWITNTSCSIALAINSLPVIPRCSGTRGKAKKEPSGTVNSVTSPRRSTTISLREVKRSSIGERSMSCALTTAFCNADGAQTNVCCFNFNISSISRSGPAAYPNRQPVHPWVLEYPRTMSTSSEKEAGLACVVGGKINSS